MAGLWAPCRSKNNFHAWELLRDDGVEQWLDATKSRRENWSTLPVERIKLTLRESIVRSTYVRSVPELSPCLPSPLPEPLCVMTERELRAPPKPETLGRTVRMIRKVSQFPQITLEKCQYLATQMEEFSRWHAQNSKDYDPLVIPWDSDRQEAECKATVKRVYKIREQQQEHKRITKLRAEEKARREEEQRLRQEKLKADRLARACILEDEPPPSRRRSIHTVVKKTAEHQRSRTRTKTNAFWNSNFGTGSVKESPFQEGTSSRRRRKKRSGNEERRGSAESPVGSGVAAIRAGSRFKHE